LNMNFGTSNIDCNATHYCVLWAGVDYNQAFTSGSHAFSTPFEVDAPASAVSGGPVTAPVTGPGKSDPSVSSTITSAKSAGAGAPMAPAGPALAVTGPPVPVLWLLGLGMVLILLGLLGRRVVAKRSS
jgi:hypothetical protein